MGMDEAKWRPHPKQAEFMREPPKRIALASAGRVGWHESVRMTRKLYAWLLAKVEARGKAG